jgi:thymidine phosphorylase
MGQVLGRHVGNALEIREAIDVLTGGRATSGCTRVSALTRELLVLGGLARDGIEAGALVESALDSGAAAERFARMVRALGGPADIVECPDRHLRAGAGRAGRGAAGRRRDRADRCARAGLAVVELAAAAVASRTRSIQPLDSPRSAASGEAVDRDRRSRSCTPARPATAEGRGTRVRQAVTVREEPTAASASPVLRRMVSAT